MATDLQAETNAIVRLFDRYGRESILVVLVAVCVIVTIGNYIKADRAESTANAASAKVLVLTDINDRLRDENKQLITTFNITKNKVTRLQSTLYARGVSIEEIYDD